MPEPAILEGTRRDILDMLLGRDTPFHGRLDAIDFLRRVWDLDAMPSTDDRFQTAARDLWQHTVNNNDWDDSYLLYRYFTLLQASDAVFLRFLSVVVDPVALPSESEARDLVAAINPALQRDGQRLVEVELRSGKPVYGAAPVHFAPAPLARTPWKKVERQIDVMHQSLTRAVSEEDYQAVGLLGREVMISLAQAVISPAEAAGDDGVAPSATDARRLLDSYIGEALPGPGNEAVRGAVRKVVQATNAVQHDRGATHRDAALIVELVASSVQLVHILDGSP